MVIARKTCLIAAIALFVLGSVSRCHSSETGALTSRIGVPACPSAFSRIGVPACPSTSTSIFRQAENPILPEGVFTASTYSGSTTDKEKRIRQSKAFWQSLLVPGLGQLAMDRKASGYAFLTAEIALIGSLVGLRTYASRLEDDYRLYAYQHAGVPTNHDHMFYVDIGNWMNERLYNEARLRDRDFEAMYTNPEDAWSWDSDNNRTSFRSMRIDSDKARNTAVLVVGGMLINHLFSAIDAARGSTTQPSMSFTPNTNGGGMVTLSLVR